jgi:arginyl-tRNA synthetase
MMDMIREDLALLGVTMDVYSSEKALYGTGQIEAAIDTLRGMGLIYEGTLEPPKGKDPRRLGAARADPVPQHRAWR